MLDPRDESTWDLCNRADIDPNLVAMMQAEIKAGEKAVTRAMREAGAGLKTA